MRYFVATGGARAELGPGPLSACTLSERMKTGGEWTDGGLWLEIAAMIVNVPPHWHWGGVPIRKEDERQLFPRVNGRQRHEERCHGRLRKGGGRCRGASSTGFGRRSGMRHRT